MNSLPLPLRVAAGLAATAVERARDLPTKLAGLPVTVASQALQLSMRVQQQVTELAIKGDEALSGLRPVEQTPEWATFDEDTLPEEPVTRANDSAFDRAGTFDGFGEPDEDDEDEDDAAEQLDEPDDSADPWAQEERALAEETAEVLAEDTDAAPEPERPTDNGAPAGVSGYDSLSLPQLRARLRSFTPDQLADLLAYERANEARPAFVGMLTRRIATVRDQT